MNYWGKSSAVDPEAYIVMPPATATAANILQAMKMLRKGFHRQAVHP